MHFDQYGLIVQGNGDGGDTFARHHGARFLQWVNYTNLGYKPIFDFPFSPEHDLTWIGPSTVLGECRRHPSSGPSGLDEPWNDPNNFTRDQLISGICHLGTWQNRYPIRRLFRRYWFKTPKDFTLPWISLWIRAFKAWWLYPILLFTDLILLGEVLERCGWLPKYKHDFDAGDGKRVGKWIWEVNEDDVGHDMNAFIMLTQAAVVLDTPITKLARKIYSRYRPLSFGSIIMGERHRVLGAIKWYCRNGLYRGVQCFGNPEWADTCVPAIRKWFKE